MFTHAIIAVIVGGDIPLAINLGFVAMFGLIAAISFLVLRQIGVVRAFAVAGAVLYALLPYHFYRTTSHLFLSGYLVVPLVALVLIWQMGGRPVFELIDGEGRRRWTWRDPRGFLSVAALAGVALTGTYYAVFGGLLLFAAAIVTFIADRDRRRLAVSAGLLGVLVLSVLTTLMPTILYAVREGPNSAAVERSYYGVELYGLRPVQLLLPISNHRIAALRQFAAEAGSTGGEQGQNLGVVGAFGLIASILAMGMAVLSRRTDSRFATVGRLGLLNTLAILLGTVAGIGALLGLLGLDEVRAWNRIVVYVAFFSIAASMLLASRWSRSLRTGVIAAIAVAVILVGAFDQTGAPNRDAYQANADAYWADSEYFEAIEEAMPVDAAVFQLPYVPFPEFPPVVDMTDYSHVRGYLHTDSVRWSYGAMKGRPGSEWQSELTTRSTEDVLVGVIASGFQGLYIDRFGYADRAAALESDLMNLMQGAQPMVSEDGRMAFYDLREYRAAIVEEKGAGYIEALRNQILSPPVSLRFEDGFYAVEGTGDNQWYWSGPEADLHIDNTTDAPLLVDFSVGLRTGTPQTSNVTVTWNDGADDVQVSATVGDYRRQFLVPPGGLAMHFATDAPRLDAPTDVRVLHLRFENPSAEVLR